MMTKLKTYNLVTNIYNLCQQFQIDEKSTLQSFRIYKMDLGKKEIPEYLKPPYKSIATISVLTSECERNHVTSKNFIKYKNCCCSFIY